MKSLHPSFIEVLKVLLECQVEFLLIGGYAVNYHGYGRPTGDMDLWLQPDNTNKRKCLAAFKKLHYAQQSIQNINNLDFEKTQVFFIGEVPLRIDFLTNVNLVDFEDACKKRKYYRLMS
jgi:predicted nucleotidyltransferase